MKKLFLLCNILIASLFGNTANTVQQPSLIISTDYGNFEIKEPVLCKLFELPALKRTQYIEQYGIDKYVCPEYPSYSRYKHCVGVWALLRLFGASIEEQIAGLLHDVSHTVFSHAGDRLFNHMSITSSYKETIHEWYLDMVKIRLILKEYGLAISDILVDKDINPMLEQPLPDLCADRLEYNLQGGLMEKMLTREDVKTIIADIRFEAGKWYFNTPVYARKLADVALYHTQYVWGGPVTYFRDKFFNGALQEAIDTGLVSIDDIHFGHDKDIWGKLITSNDIMIQKYIKLTLNTSQMLANQDKNGTTVSVATKFRGIDPLVKVGNTLKRLTEIDTAFKEEFEQVRTKVADWKVRIPQEITEQKLATPTPRTTLNEKIELTIQLLPKDFDQFKTWLINNARYQGQEEHTEYYLDNPKNSFYFYNEKKDFKDALCTLTVRCTDNKDSVCYNYLHIDPKTGLTTHQDEHETIVANGNQALSLFTMLGFSDKITIHKTRTMYKVNCFEIYIDEVKDVGTFVKIELINDVNADITLIYDFLKAHNIHNFKRIDRNDVHMVCNPGHDFGKEISL